MPDDDRIPTSLTAPWKKVLRCLRSRRPAEETTDAVTTAMAATLRDVHGTRELQDLFSEILASDQISKLAKRLLARPTGEGLRAPDRRRRARMSLEDFINTPIAEL